MLQVHAHNYSSQVAEIGLLQVEVSLLYTECSKPTIDTGQNPVSKQNKVTSCNLHFTYDKGNKVLHRALAGLEHIV